MLLIGVWWLLALGGVAANLRALQGPPRTPFASQLFRRASNNKPVPVFNLTNGLNMNEYGPWCFTQKKSHFDKELNGTFCQRYQVDKTFYKEGGPVFLTDPGEVPDMGGNGSAHQGAFIYHLAKTHNGLVVNLEHRYYGYSYPVPDLTTDNLRWMTLNEALEDTAEFIRHFPTPDGLKAEALKPSATPWFYIGGSYPGSRAAWTRGRYPDLVWGSIASSAVLVNPENGMMDNFLTWGKWSDPACVKNFEAAMIAMDSVLDKSLHNKTLDDEFKDFFHARGLSHWRLGLDVQSLTVRWQEETWTRGLDEEDNFNHSFCDKMKQPVENVTIAGEVLPGSVKTWRDWLNSIAGTDDRGCGNITDLSVCADEQGDVYSFNVPPKTYIDAGDNDRVWSFQMCNHFGMFAQGPQEGSPYPRLASKYLTREKYIELCRHYFQPGEHFRLGDVIPDPKEMADKGGLNYTYPRIAWTNGEQDPWATTQKPEQPSTPDNPYYFIKKAGHVWDHSAYDDLDKEPDFIQTVHRGLLGDIGRWIKEFHNQHNATAA